MYFNTLQYGDKVYHVANPTIMGIVVSTNPKSIPYLPTVAVYFKEPVEFSTNEGGKERAWICSANLLYECPVIAQANSDPDLKDFGNYIRHVNKELQG